MSLQTFTNNAATSDVTFESVLKAVKKIKALGTPYGPIVVTPEEFAELKKCSRDVSWKPAPLGGFFFNSFDGMEVEIVDSSEQVMPMVRELRRRGKRPVFVGMITFEKLEKPVDWKRLMLQVF